jgi:hypothetical protein
MRFVAQRRLLVVSVVLAALLSGTVGAATAGASGGNSVDAKLCQKNGWQTVETDNGAGFATNDECTSYAANGGLLFAPALTLTPGGCFGFNGTLYAFEHFSAIGFHPNSTMSFFLPGQQYPLPLQVPVVSDANGSAELPGYVIFSPGEAAGLTAVDAQGVHASIALTASC